MGGPPVPDDRRRLLLRAALGFLQLPPRALRAAVAPPMARHVDRRRAHRRGRRASGASVLDESHGHGRVAGILHEQPDVRAERVRGGEDAVAGSAAGGVGGYGSRNTAEARCFSYWSGCPFPPLRIISRAPWSIGLSIRWPEYPLLVIHPRIASAAGVPMVWNKYLPSELTVMLCALPPATVLHCSRSLRTFFCLSVSGAEGVVVPDGVVVPHAERATAISVDIAALETLGRYRLLMPSLIIFSWGA
jgi:hypothetical protein